MRRSTLIGGWDWALRSCSRSGLDRSERVDSVPEALPALSAEWVIFLSMDYRIFVNDCVREQMISSYKRTVLQFRLRIWSPNFGVGKLKS